MLELPALTSWATFILAVLGIIGMVGAFWALSRSYVRTLNEIQTEVIDAYKEKVSLLKEKVAQLEAVITTIQIVLKRQGTEITIDDDIVTLQQRGVRKAVTVRVQHDTSPKSDD